MKATAAIVLSAMTALLVWAGLAVAQSASQAVALPPGCAGRTDVLGLSRIVEIDTTGSPRFGVQYNDIDFLEDHEVVLTFDDGPLHRYTKPVLDALDAQCTKATFFIVGRMAIADPETLKETYRRGHTIGSHTWSHKKLSTLSLEHAKSEIELGLSAVTKALGEPVVPFFRFPYLRDSKNLLSYLEGRNMGVFGINVDARDFLTRSPGAVMRNVLSQLAVTKKGIILFHDIQPASSGALATLMAEMKKRGFRVVHMVAKGPATTLPEYDAMAEKALANKQLAARIDPLSKRSVVWPIGAAKAAPAVPAPPKPGAGEVLPWQTTTAPQPQPPSTAAAKPPATTAQHHTPAGTPDEPWPLKPLGN